MGIIVIRNATWKCAEMGDSTPMKPAIRGLMIILFFAQPSVRSVLVEMESSTMHLEKSVMMAITTTVMVVVNVWSKLVGMGDVSLMKHVMHLRWGVRVIVTHYPVL